MNFKAKAYLRLGATIGSIVGVLTMIIAVCMGKTLLGAILLLVCVGIGIVSGNIVEKKLGTK